VPVIVSDNTHVPFTSSINWNAFTVAIPERALLQVGRMHQISILFFFCVPCWLFGRQKLRGLCSSPTPYPARVAHECQLFF
jgi:hypothetical protein